jgi:hypothetical protein
VIQRLTFIHESVTHESPCRVETDYVWGYRGANALVEMLKSWLSEGQTEINSVFTGRNMATGEWPIAAKR